ncbi:aminoglycoside phosphotransferase family protein [Nonomuraea sp. NPDC005650]|uniref:phosphotransferase family protein n=1 Tax=Nonomuraea sp. NPDC005650 TaxID=3157045 RepID=UPI0033B5000C
MDDPLSWLAQDAASGPLPIREGQFHRVVIGSDRVVCLPRTEAAAVRLPQRAATLRVLNELALGFHIPRPLFEGAGETPYLVLSRVPGAPLEGGVLDDPAAAGAVAKQYAELLSALAQAGADEQARAALPRTPQDRWQRFEADVHAELFELMSDAGRRRAERELAAASRLPHVATSVTHGDLGAENVLWEIDSGRPQLTGVIDWDEVTIGDPAEDLAAIAASHGDTFLDQVLALGGWTDNETSARVAAIRGTFALQQALAAHRDGDAEELADGLTHYT